MQKETILSNAENSNAEKDFFFWGIISIPLFVGIFIVFASFLLGYLINLLTGEAPELLMAVWKIGIWLIMPGYFVYLILAIPLAFLTKLFTTKQNLVFVILLPVIFALVDYSFGWWLYGLYLSYGYLNVAVGLLAYYYLKKKGCCTPSKKGAS